MENLQNDDDEIVTFCADGEVIWKSEIERLWPENRLGRLKARKIRNAKLRIVQKKMEISL